jgi:hypothetical protein
MLPFSVLYKIIWAMLTQLAKGIRLVVSLVRRIRPRLLPITGYEKIPNGENSGLSLHFKKTLCRDGIRVHFVGAW